MSTVIPVRTQDTHALSVFRPHFFGGALSKKSGITALIFTDMKALVSRLFDEQAGGDRMGTLQVQFYDENVPEVVQLIGLDINFGSIVSFASYVSAARAIVLNYANNVQSYGISGSDIFFLAPSVPAELSLAPQAAIANAPADAVTNYNTVTTLLGALTGAVNTANSKQNDIATKFNALLSELRTLGLIAS